ncbi:hypothetical protein NKH16_01310 [Mesorhizobium sp. M1307]|uniref:hypothetical protein n=1 Tax=Mesorhizobium sp. M1307 TaxID=2957079 RepID=UPI003338F68A
MNVRRGLFRLWMVLSAIWAIVVGLMFFDEIRSPYLQENNYLYVEGAEEIVKIPDFNSRYEMRKTMTEVTFPHNVSLFTGLTTPDEKMQARVPRFLIEYVEPRQAEIDAKRRDKVEMALMVALIPIAVIFALGGALLWALSGFARPKQPPLAP